MASLPLPSTSLLILVAVDAVRLLHLVWESDKAHRSLGGAAVLAGPGDGVTDTSVSQPAGVAAIEALELPGGVHVADRGDLRPVIDARLHSLVKGQSVGLHQPIEASCRESKTHGREKDSI